MKSRTTGWKRDVDRRERKSGTRKRKWVEQ
jgi:hypothetical protein